MTPDEMFQPARGMADLPTELVANLMELWPQAAGELSGLALHLDRNKGGITSTQLRMAVALAQEAFDARQRCKLAAKSFADMTESELHEYFTLLALHIELALPEGPSKHGKALFALLVFDESCIGQYVSNATRPEIIKTLRQCADRLEAKEDIQRSKG